MICWVHLNREGHTAGGMLDLVQHVITNYLQMAQTKDKGKKYDIAPNTSRTTYLPPSQQQN